MSRNNRDLTPARLLYLAAVRHYGQTNTRQVARLLGKSQRSANVYVYGSRDWVGLLELGYVTRERGKQQTLRLTEAGLKAARDIALIFDEGGEASVGRITGII